MTIFVQRRVAFQKSESLIGKGYAMKIDFQGNELLTGMAASSVQRIFVCMCMYVHIRESAYVFSSTENVFGADGVNVRNGKTPFEGAELLTGKAGSAAEVVFERFGSRWVFMFLLVDTCLCFPKYFSPFALHPLSS